jgi:hypothetical protein
MAGGVNLGAAENAKLKVEESVISLVADNAKLPPRKKITKVSVMADLWEINLDNLATLDGIGTLTSVAASPISPTAEVVLATGSWGSNAPLFFAGRQATGLVATAIVVKNGASTLVLGTDYSIILENGKTGIVRIGTALATTGIGINVAYTYTPAASKSYTGKDIMKLIGLYQVEIYNIDENGKKFGITIPQAYNSAGIEWSFSPDEKLDQVMKQPVEFTAFPDSTNTLFVMYDEQVY